MTGVPERIDELPQISGRPGVDVDRWDQPLDSSDYTPMEITYGQRGDGMFGPSIDLDQSWTQLEKLRWHAAVICARTGLPYLRVAERRKTWRSPWRFLIWYDLYTSCSCAEDYQEAWDFINHICYGAEAMKRHLLEEKT